MSAGPLRVGVIGLGFGRFHANCLAALPAAHVAAVAGREREDLGMTVAAFGDHHGARAFRDGAELLAAPLELDAVVLATPPTGRPALVAAALERGLAVLLEKPVAYDVGEADALAALVERTGGHVEVNHEMRHLPVVVELKRLLDEGALGDVLLITCDYVMGRPPAGSWVLDAADPGPVVENTCHAFDLVGYLAGPATRVYAEPGGPERQPVTSAAVTLRLAGGGAVALAGGGVAVDELGVRPYLSVYGTAGQATLEGVAHQLHRLRWGRPGEAPTELDAGAPASSHLEVGPLEVPSLLLPAVADFVGRVRAGSAPCTSVRAATESVRLAQAALRSIATGCPVDVRVEAA